MRASRLLAARLAMFEMMLRDATTDADRKRIVLAIRQVRGEAKSRLNWGRDAQLQLAEEFRARNRGAA